MSAAAAAAVSALARVSGKHAPPVVHTEGEAASREVGGSIVDAIDASRNSSEDNMAPGSSVMTATPLPAAAPVTLIAAMVAAMSPTVAPGLGVVTLSSTSVTAPASSLAASESITATNTKLKSHSSTPSVSSISSAISINSTAVKNIPARSSPPPAFLIDDDPFANLSAAPCHTMSSSGSSSSASASGSGQLLTSASVGAQVKRPPRLDPHALTLMPPSSGPLGPVPRSPLHEVPEVDSDGERSDTSDGEAVSTGGGDLAASSVDGEVEDQHKRVEVVDEKVKEQSPEKGKVKEKDKDKVKDKKEKEGSHASTRKRAKSFFGAMSAPTSPSKGFFFSSSSSSSGSTGALLFMFLPDQPVLTYSHELSSEPASSTHSFSRL